MKRYALVAIRQTMNGPAAQAEVVAAYLPANYKVIWHGPEGIVIQGEDRSGWTLDGYVIPRLGSGSMKADEIDLSHDVMKLVPA